MSRLAGPGAGKSKLFRLWSSGSGPLELELEAAGSWTWSESGLRGRPGATTRTQSGGSASRQDCYMVLAPRSTTCARFCISSWRLSLLTVTGHQGTAGLVNKTESRFMAGYFLTLRKAGLRSSASISRERSWHSVRW